MKDKPCDTEKPVQAPAAAAAAAQALRVGSEVVPADVGENPGTRALYVTKVLTDRTRLRITLTTWLPRPSSTTQDLATSWI